MGSEYYFIYCKGILGVKTNRNNFKWIYGSEAPCGTVDQYEKCAVKFEIFVDAEKNLPANDSIAVQFQSYSWNDTDSTLYYRRRLPLNILIGYNIRFCGNTVYASVGSNYYRYVQNRTMNLHGIYYLLSDIANIMLLRLGYITLYASCAYHTEEGRSILAFAAPGTGKTYLAINLCTKGGYSLIGEDIVISDGKKAYACPWTSSYKNRRSLLDSAFTLKNGDYSSNSAICDECELEYITVLTLGRSAVEKNKERIFKQVQILNGYVFQHHCSPIVKILGYFDDSFHKQWAVVAESILKEMIYNYHSYEFRCEDRKDFSDIMDHMISGMLL